MYKIVIVTSRKEAFRAFGNALETGPVEVALTWVPSGADALNAAKKNAPDLIVVDDSLQDTDGLSLIRQLLGINAMINTALVSRLSDDAFHEATEGLGVLSNLALDPDGSDAEAVLATLTEIVGPK
jgi:CheY-like chemotaxis protein